MKKDYKNLLQERILEYSDKLMDSEIHKLPIGLFYGKMGICIYYFHLSEYTNNLKYQSFAEKLFEDICSDIESDNDTIDFDIGLSGIAWGLIYLNQQSFLGGDTDETLKEIDDKIFHDLNFLWLDKSQRDIHALLKILIYLLKRMESGIWENERVYIYENLIIKIINKLESEISPDELEDPPFFDLFSYHLVVYLLILVQVYRKNIYCDKIKMIWIELSDKILSSFPRLHANRLLLLMAMEEVCNCIELPGWKEHILLLENHIDIKNILERELVNRSIFIKNGISGLLLINMLLKGNKKTRIIHRFMPEIEDFILNSEFWVDGLLSEEKIVLYAGVINGISGIGLTYMGYEEN